MYVHQRGGSFPPRAALPDALPQAELKPAFWKLPPRAHMTAARELIRPLLTLRGHEESTTLYPLWLFLGAAPGTCGMVVPLLQVRKRQSVVPCESESRLHSAHLHDHRTFPSRERGSVNTHLLRGRVPLSLAAPGRLVREQRDGISWSKRAARDHVMVAVGRVGAHRGERAGVRGDHEEQERKGVLLD